MSKSQPEIQALTDALAETKKELSKAHSSLEVISRMAKTIHSTLNTDELSNLVMNIIESLMGFEAFSLLVFDNEQQFLFKGERNLPQDVFQNLLEKVEENKHIWIKKAGKPHPIRESTYGLDMLCYPLESSGRTIGAFCASRKTIELLTSEDVRMLSLIATQISTAFQNSLLYELARKLSITDEITKVYNQCYLRSQLETEARRAQRYSRPLSLLIIGLNNFESYRRQFGDVLGDRALFETAGIIQNTCRCVDLVARYSEDEFAIVLPETPVEGASKAGARIKKAIEEHQFLDNQGERTQKLTVCLGASSFSGKAGHKELIKEAVEVVRQAKSSAGNEECRTPINSS